MKRYRMAVQIRQITIGNLGGVDKIFGLGYDNRVYYWTSEGWKALV